LGLPEVEKILELEVTKVKQRLAPKGIVLRIEEAANGFLIEKGYDRAYGARPLRRAIERYLEDPLAEAILRGTIQEGGVIDVTLDDDHLIFEQLAGTS